jgi:hypothetical protein
MMGACPGQSFGPTNSKGVISWQRLGAPSVGACLSHKLALRRHTASCNP